MSISNFLQPGRNGMGVIDLTGAAEALASVTIGGVTYQEADTADATLGIWTNGASAADGVTSLVAAINGDLRGSKPDIIAIPSTVGDSLIVMANNPGAEGNLAIVVVSAAVVTAVDMSGGIGAQRRNIVVVDHHVTAQDVLADQINIPLPFVPTGMIVNFTSATGLQIAASALMTIETGPDRIRAEFAGATDLAADEHLHVIAWE